MREQFPSLTSSELHEQATVPGWARADVGRRQFLGIAVVALAGVRATYPPSHASRPPAGRVYVISTQADFDRHRQATFQPGDHIRFQRGKVFYGQFAPRGSGTLRKAIVVDAYGEGALPVINGNGAGAAFWLHNSGYWEISNLEITNPTNGTTMARRGIYISAEDCGVVNHIYVQDTYIHDVAGDISTRQIAKNSNGVRVAVTGGTTATYFNDIRILNNRIEDIDGVGIGTQTSWAKRAENPWGQGPWTPFQGLIVGNNALKNTAKDGILVNGAKGALVEHNSLDNTASKLNGAGAWPYNSDDTVFQFNEAFNTKLLSSDGAGFDADWACNRTIFQYNYSHDNEGGAFNIQRKYNKNLVIRYNVSQNDHTFLMYGFPDTELENARIYNNIFYAGPGIDPIVIRRQPAIGTTFSNNIFYVQGTASWGAGIDGSSTATHNLFHGGITPQGANYLVADPQFVAAGSGGLGIDSVLGYRLLDGSPAIGSGVRVTRDGGRDYWGNPIPTPPNIGAYAGQGVAG